MSLSQHFFHEEKQIIDIQALGDFIAKPFDICEPKELVEKGGQISFLLEKNPEAILSILESYTDPEPDPRLPPGFDFSDLRLYLLPELIDKLKAIEKLSALEILFDDKYIDRIVDACFLRLQDIERCIVAPECLMKAMNHIVNHPDYVKRIFDKSGLDFEEVIAKINEFFPNKPDFAEKFQECCNNIVTAQKHF